MTQSRLIFHGAYQSEDIGLVVACLDAGGCRSKFSKKLGEGKCNDTGASRFFFVIIVFILTKCLRIVSIQDHLMDAYLGVHGVGNWVIGLVWGSVNRRVVVGWSWGRLLGWW